MPDLEQQIAEAHSDLEATEQQAKQLEARLRGIPGMERLMPAANHRHGNRMAFRRLQLFMTVEKN